MSSHGRTTGQPRLLIGTLMIGDFYAGWKDLSETMARFSITLEGTCFKRGYGKEEEEVLMDKAATLRIVNPLLGILLLNQPLSIILSTLTGWDVFEGLHIVGGIGLLILAAIHLMLNWGWVRMNFLKTAKKKA
jgi:hypothetical protein